MVFGCLFGAFFFSPSLAPIKNSIIDAEAARFSAMCITALESLATDRVKLRRRVSKISQEADAKGVVEHHFHPLMWTKVQQALVYKNSLKATGSQ